MTLSLLSKEKVPSRALQARLIVVAGLLVFFSLALATALGKSPTNDEPLHVLRGVLMMQTGDLRHQSGHPPFSHRLIGLFLPGEQDLPEITTLEQWPSGNRLFISEELLWARGLDVRRILFLARLPIALTALLLGAAICSWSLAWNGRAAVVVSAVLFGFSPNLLASGTLATTDLAAAATYFLAVYAWWLTWRRSRENGFTGQRNGLNRRFWLATAVLLGLAIATKLTAALLLPVLFLQGYIYYRRGDPLWAPTLAWFAMLPLAGLVLWLVYGLEFGQAWSSGPAVPAATYVASWRNVLAHIERGHRAFFLGELSGKGWWYYFPVTFALKTPLATLGLLVIGLVSALLRRELRRTALFLLLPILALFAAAMTSRLNIGYRHILPVLPLVLVLAGAAAPVLTRRPVTRLVLALALVWYGFSGLRQHPDHLAYTNELTGGKAGGYRYFGDSNLDWGQDLNLLAAYVASQGGTWRIAYSGIGDPAYYGLPESALIDVEEPLQFAAANPPPASYAISANFWQGVLTDADLFDWFRRQEVADNLGGSILIYDVRSQTTGDWVAHCLDPSRLLTNEEAEILLDRPGARHLEFDCRQTWVFPEDGAPGWYVLPQADAWWVAETLVPEQAAQLQLVYRHDPGASLPSFDVYYWPGGTPESVRLAGTATVLANEVPESLPNLLGDRLWLQDYLATATDWYTTWRVETADPQPLSLQAHLNTGGPPPLVADGLGFCCGQWQPDDWFIQRHVFPEHSGAQYLETGLYNYVTLEPVSERLRLPGP
jgi:hypothetical protein